MVLESILTISLCSKLKRKESGKKIDWKNIEKALHIFHISHKKDTSTKARVLESELAAISFPSLSQDRSSMVASEKLQDFTMFPSLICHTSKDISFDALAK